ncbi:MAG: CAP domain-containing protein [Anaerovoracaceae bacterium]
MNDTYSRSATALENGEILEIPQIAAPQSSDEPADSNTDGADADFSGTVKDKDDEAAASGNSPKHRHQYKSAVTKPTCQSQGYTTYTCSCGHSYRDDVTAALGHSFGSWTVETKPTVSAPGKQSRTCTRCGEKETAGIQQLADTSAFSQQVIALVNQERSAAGENIAAGYDTPQAVMNGWMNSPGHRSNILSSDFAYIGVGCYEANGRLYWTQIFAG